MNIKVFTFNPFQENTYILWDDTLECIIIDPGCYFPEERQTLDEFIQSKKLTPVRLLNTHCHLDHVFGNYHVSTNYNLKLEIPKGEEEVLHRMPAVCASYGVPLHEPLKDYDVLLTAADTITFGNTLLTILLTPGHSPASLCFYHATSNQLIAGDVLFQGSIGRTDLPGGDHQTLLNSIQEQLYVLPDETIVFPGHGPTTTIGVEKRSNPFTS